MELTLSHCFIPVLDQDAALRFYSDVLGLEVRTDVTMDSMRWLTVGPRSQPDVEISLLPAAGPFVAPADRETVEALVAKGAMYGVIFRTDDTDATFERIRAAGAEVLQEPIDQSYGVRDCAFRDPSGNHIRFSGPLSG
jgi:catechol 2,3-dioxygenase-like lactoylglutathione lyase family enzyme